MLVRHAKLGDMVECMPGEATHRPEFLALNPFHGVPTLQDGAFSLAEPSAILRYLAAYAVDFYPADWARRAEIDSAMEHFCASMHADVVKTIHVALGFRPEPSPEHLIDAGQAASRGLAAFAERFLRGTFVGGDVLSIADFRVAPFFAAYGHNLLHERCHVELPDRIRRFNKDFAEACEASAVLREASGFAIEELLDAKARTWGMSQSGSPCSCRSSGLLSPTVEGLQRAVSGLLVSIQPSQPNCLERCGCTCVEA